MATILMALLSWVHILAAVLWLGGGAFFTFLVVPNLTGLQPPDAGKVSGAISKKFTPLVLLSAAVLAITGILRMYLTGSLNPGYLFSTSGVTLLLKLLVYVVILVVAHLITTTAKTLEEGSSPEVAMAAQKRIALLSKTNIALMVIVILLASGSRYGGF
ncbi:MAG: DUF4149 domain-containing protein [Candidatus Hydrothermarchaeales archaeon]